MIWATSYYPIMKTDEQKAADAALREAVAASCRAYDLVPADATIVDFVGVVEALRYGNDDPDDMDEFRALLYQDGMMRSSTAVGLLGLGRAMMVEAIAGTEQG